MLLQPSVIRESPTFYGAGFLYSACWEDPATCSCPETDEPFLSLRPISLQCKMGLYIMGVKMWEIFRINISDKKRKMFNRATTVNRRVLLTQLPYWHHGPERSVWGDVGWIGLATNGKNVEFLWIDGNDPASSYVIGMFFIIFVAISWNLRNCFAMWSQIVRILIWVKFFYILVITIGPAVM